MTEIVCPASIVEKTLAMLRQAGTLNKERVAFWLAPRGTDSVSISEIFAPEQQAAMDYFRISPASMRTLMAHLRQHRLILAAQVHSHPGLAFHSEADNAWAIVRHESALSIVVPYFARDITVETFLGESAVFRLSATDVWEEITGVERDASVAIR